VWRKRFKVIRQKLYIPLMLTPALLVVIGLFGGGILNAVIEGFGYIPALNMTDFTFDHYIGAVTRPDFIQSLLFGLKISIVPNIISLTISLFIATQLVKRFRGRGVLKFIFRMPLQIPGLVTTFMMLVLLTDGGLLARAAYHLGLVEVPSDFLHLLYDKNGIGIIVVSVWGQVAFVSLVLFSFLLGLDTNFEEAARTLGANDWNVFRYVNLPMMMPAILVVTLLNFAFSFGGYATPRILGPTSPTTLPVLAYNIFTSPELRLRPQAMALSVVISLICGVILVAYTYVWRRMQYTETKVRR
jgi:putative spermidine/putrescine transport system permease protein